MRMRHVASTTLAILCLHFTLYPQQVIPPAKRALPPPFETLQDSKQFEAARFGPGNTISFVEPPPDFQLSAFAISFDGGFIAMGWASGRIELRDLHTKSKAREFKSGFGTPQLLQFNPSGDELVVTGSGGRITFLHVPDGKKVREWRIPLGKYKYDVQEVVFDPHGKWLAYADEEASKVLDLATNPPQTLADLEDAGSLALSQGGNELWTVDRSVLERFSTGTWRQTGRWPLKSEPVNTAPVVIQAGVGPGGQGTVAVPSSKGLVIYDEHDMEGSLVTYEPTSRVVFASGSKTYVDLSKDLTLVTAEGSVLCTMSYRGGRDYAVSGDGQWLALSQDASVDLWRVDDLLRDCSTVP